MLSKFLHWLKGHFTCERCGRVFFVNTFGFGTTICPDCYSGESIFIFLDDSYWLNRILRFRTPERGFRSTCAPAPQNDDIESLKVHTRARGL